MFTISWRQDLVSGTAVEATLEALTSYGLASQSQHLELLQCPGIVLAIVGQLKTPAATTITSTQAAPQTPEQHAIAEAALEATISLTISPQGLKTLIEAGAVDVACSLLCALCGQQTCREPPSKRRTTNPGALEQPTMDDAVQDLVVLLVQLLAALLLEPSPARPAAGSLDANLATDTAATLLQVLSERCCPEVNQQPAAALLMRLAMEPGVAAVLCQQADPAAVVAAQQSGKGVGPCPTQQSPPPATSEIQPSLSSNSSHSQSTGDLCLLLGQQISQDLFYQSHWERQPLLCRAPQDASHSSGAQTLAEALTPSGVLEHLLPRAPHCPVLPACMEDPVQVLQELHAQGQLLLPLQPSDMRIIKAQAPNPAAAQSPSSPHGPHEPYASTAPAHDRHSAHRADPAVASAGSTRHEVLLDISGGVSAAAVPAALAAGFTVVLRNVPKRCWAVAQMAEMLEAQLGLPAGANMYLTPAGAQGLQAHYDDHDVFVLQLAGSKTWLVGPPQHQHLPLTHQPRLPVVPPDLYCPDHQPPAASYMYSCAVHPGLSEGTATAPKQCLEGQQVPGGGVVGQQGVQVVQPASQGSNCWPQQLVLQPGDCLYIPRGWVHQAVTPASAPATAAAAAHQTVPGFAVDLQQAGSAAQGMCSLHVSVGVEVSADASVQGFLQHLLGTCASRVLAGACNCCCPSTAKSSGGSSEQQRIDPLAVQAAALLLQLRLWQQGRQYSVYRKACPLLASGRTAELLSHAVLSQLQRAHHAHHTAPCVESTEPVASTTTPDPPQRRQALSGPGLTRPELPTGDQLHQLHQPWLNLAVQQLVCCAPCEGGRGDCAGPAGLAAPTARKAEDTGRSAPAGTPAARSLVSLQPALSDLSALSGPGVASCSCWEPLLQLAEQLLGCMLASHASGPGQSAETGEAEGGLLELCSQLEAAAVGSTCSICGSTCCHSGVLFAAAVLRQLRPAATGGGGDSSTLQGEALLHALRQHASVCACCAALLLRGSAAGLQYGAAGARLHAMQHHTSSGSRADTTAHIQIPQQGHSSTPYGSTTAAQGVTLASTPGGVDAEAFASQQLLTAAQQMPAALACLHRSLGCMECRTAAVAGYSARARAELASCQAVRRGFLALASLSQQQHWLGSLQQ